MKPKGAKVSARYCACACDCGINMTDLQDVVAHEVDGFKISTPCSLSATIVYGASECYGDIKHFLLNI